MGRPFSEVARAFTPLPQQLKNLRVPKRPDMSRPEIVRVIEAGEAQLNGHGRLVVRPSGTEPLIRVMVEADDEALLHAVLDEVSHGLEAAI
jgi:phosphoglucosamine mutase